MKGNVVHCDVMCTKYGSIQCGAVQCIALQCIAVQYAVRCDVAWCSAVPYPMVGTVWCGSAWYKLYCMLKCSVVQSVVRSSMTRQVKAVREELESVKREADEKAMGLDLITETRTLNHAPRAFDLDT